MRGRAFFCFNRKMKVWGQQRVKSDFTVKYSDLILHRGVSTLLNGVILKSVAFLDMDDFSSKTTVI